MKRRDFVKLGFTFCSGLLVKIKYSAAQAPFAFWKHDSSGIHIRITKLVLSAAARSQVNTQMLTTKFHMLVASKIDSNSVEMRVTRNVLLAAAQTNSNLVEMRATRKVLLAAVQSDLTVNPLRVSNVIMRVAAK